MNTLPSELYHRIVYQLATLSELLDKHRKRVLYYNVVQQLEIATSCIRGSLSRQTQPNDGDAIVRAPDGRWGLFVKGYYDGPYPLWFTEGAAEQDLCDIAQLVGVKYPGGMRHDWIWHFLE